MSSSETLFCLLCASVSLWLVLILMHTSAVLFPLVTLLLLPLVAAVLLHAARSWRFGRPASLRSRIGWAALCLAVGIIVTTAVLQFGMLCADRCRAQPRGAVAEA